MFYTFLPDSLSWTLLVTSIPLLFYVIYSFLFLPYYKAFHLFRQGVPWDSPLMPGGILIETIIAHMNNAVFDIGQRQFARHESKTLTFLLGLTPFVSTCDGDYAIEAFALKHAHSLYKGDITVAMASPLIGYNNLLLVDQKQHTQKRRMMSAAFHFSSIRAMIDAMSAQTIKMFRHISQDIDSDPRGSSKRLIHQMFQSITFDIISACAFSDGFDQIAGSKDAIHHALADMMPMIQQRFMSGIDQIPILNQLPMIYKTALDKGSADLQRYCSLIISRRREDMGSGKAAYSDLLQQLIDARDIDTGERFTDEMIRDEVETFLFAGHESSATTLTWLLYELLRSPQLYQQCREEVDRVIGIDYRSALTSSQPTLSITSDQLNDLHIIDAVAMETLRHYPPIGVMMRQALTDLTLAPAKLPPLHISAGTCISINVHCLHHSEEYYGESASVFDHTRWLQDHPHYHKPSHPAAFIPFSTGPRNCIGSTFALQEIKIITALIVSIFDCKLVANQRVESTVAITRHPAVDIQTIFKLRKS